MTVQSTMVIMDICWIPMTLIIMTIVRMCASIEITGTQRHMTSVSSAIMVVVASALVTISDPLEFCFMLVLNSIIMTAMTVTRVTHLVYVDTIALRCRLLCSISGSLVDIHTVIIMGIRK